MSEQNKGEVNSNNVNDYLRSLSEQKFVEILQNKFNVQLAPNSRRSLQNLYHDLQIGETWFEFDPESEGELVRNTKVANADVFYISSAGKIYTLKEDKRLTLPKGSTPEDYFQGKIEPIRVQPQRKTNHSISERMRTHIEDQEEPMDAAIRGISEEIFGNEHKDFISKNLQFNGIVVATRSKDDKDNSYAGMKVTYHNHNFTLIIPEPDKPLFEFDSAKGYLNTFVWEEIPAIEQITFINEEGREQTRTIISENSPDILREVMACEQKKDKYDYELRTKIIRISNGKIETCQAYTRNPLILDDEYRKREDLGSYLGNPENWLPERVELHKRIIEREFAKIEKLSEALNESVPTIFMLRGNNGAGKSSLLKSHEHFRKAQAVNFEGVINTDFYDAALKQKSIVDGKTTVTAQQVHEEGNFLEKEIRRRALEQSDLSIIFDKRFSYEKQFKEILDQAGTRAIEIFDLDVSLEISSARVLARKKDEDAPKVEFGTLINGFIRIRNIRKDLIEIIKVNSKISYYLLLETSSLPPVKIAWKENDFYQVAPKQDEKFSQLIEKIKIEDLEQIGETIITDTLIHDMLKAFPTETRINVNIELKKYRGKTIKEALDEASKST